MAVTAEEYIAPVKDGLVKPGSIFSRGENRYAIGGSDNISSTPIDKVFVSALAPDGTPGPWSATTPLPEPLLNVQVVEHGGRIYVLGGQRPGDFAPVAHVYMGQTLADGTISAWTQLQDMPAARTSGAALMLNGTIFYAGGWLAQAGAPAEQTVFIANATPSGLGFWGLSAETLLRASSTMPAWPWAAT